MRTNWSALHSGTKRRLKPIVWGTAKHIKNASVKTVTLLQISLLPAVFMVSAYNAVKLPRLQDQIANQANEIAGLHRVAASKNAFTLKLFAAGAGLSTILTGISVFALKNQLNDVKTDIKNDLESVLGFMIRNTENLVSTVCANPTPILNKQHNPSGPVLPNASLKYGLEPRLFKFLGIKPHKPGLGNLLNKLGLPKK